MLWRVVSPVTALQPTLLREERRAMLLAGYTEIVLQPTLLREERRR